MRPSQVMMTAIMVSVVLIRSRSSRCGARWPSHLNVAQLCATPAPIAMTTCVVGAIPSLFEFDEGERERSIVAAMTCLEQCPNSWSQVPAGRSFFGQCFEGSSQG